MTLLFNKTLSIKQSLLPPGNKKRVVTGNYESISHNSDFFKKRIVSLYLAFFSYNSDIFLSEFSVNSLNLFFLFRKQASDPCRISVLSCLNSTLRLGKCYLNDFQSFERPVPAWHLPHEQAMQQWASFILWPLTHG